MPLSPEEAAFYSQGVQKGAQSAPSAPTPSLSAEDSAFYTQGQQIDSTAVIPGFGEDPNAAANLLRTGSIDNIRSALGDENGLVNFYRQNFKSFWGDEVARNKFMDAFIAERTKDTSTLQTVRNFGSAISTAVKDFVVGGAKTGVNLAGAVDDALISLAVDDDAAKELREDALKRTAKVGAAADTALTGLYQLFDNTVTFDPSKADRKGWEKELIRRAVWQNALENAPKGKGPLQEGIFGKGSTLGDVIPMSEEDAVDVQQMSGFVDPTNLIPAGAALKGVKVVAGKTAFAVLDTEGKLLRAIPRASTLGKGLSLAEDAGRFSKKAATAAAATAANITGKTLQGGAKVVNTLLNKTGVEGGVVLKDLAASAIGAPHGSVIGATVGAAAAKKVGGALVDVSKKLRGEIPPGPVWESLKKAATTGPVANVAGGVAKGAAAGLGLTGDPTALIFSALGIAGAETSEELASNLAGQIGVGGLFGGGKELGAYFDVGSKLFAPVSADGKPISSPAYGAFPELDAAHAKVNADLGEVGSRINQFREAVRDTGKQVYSVDDGTYLDTLRKFREQEKGSALSEAEETDLVQDALTKGVFLQKIVAPDGTAQDIVLVRKDGSALHHEGGHLLESLLSDDERAQLRAEIPTNYSPEELASFKNTYEKALGRPISEAQLHDEIVAENLSAVLSAVPVDRLGTPAPLARRVYQTVGGLVERLGLKLNSKLPGQLISDVPFGQNYQTQLGLRPAVGLSATAEGLVRERLQQPAAPVLQPRAPRAPVAAPIAPAVRPEMLVHSGETTVGVREAGKPAATNVFVGDTSGTTVQTPGGPVEIRPLATTTATPEAAPSAEPVLQPRAEAPAAPVESPNIRATREQQNEFQGERGLAPEDTGVENADAAVRGDESLTPEQRDAYAVIRDVVEKGTAAQSPVEIEYNSVKTEEQAPGRVKRRAEQEAAYAAEREGALPEDVRSQMQKIFVPFRFFLKSDGQVGILAMSLDKVRGNIDRLVSGMVKAKQTDRVPYALKDGKFTKTSAREIIRDVQTYTANQSNGYAGTGERVTVPESFFGTIPAETPGYVPTPLSETKSQFINTLMGVDLGPPKTARRDASRPVPANVSARQLAEANQRPVEVALRAKKDAKFGELPITETNPLRNELRRSGLSETLENLESVTERVDLKNIKEAKVRTDLEFSRPVTDLVRAGFLPDATKALPEDTVFSVQRPTRFGKANVPGFVQIDFFNRGDNTRSTNIQDLRREGYVVPDVPADIPEGRYTEAELRAEIAKRPEGHEVFELNEQGGIPFKPEYADVSAATARKARFEPDNDPVEATAVRLQSGEVISGRGKSHAMLTIEAIEAGKSVGDQDAPGFLNQFEDGFVTKSGAFLPRGEALLRSIKSGQINESFNGETNGLESQTFEMRRSFSPDAETKVPEATRDLFTAKRVGEILDHKNWAILTAENPAAKEATPEANAERNAELEQSLTEQGLDVIPVEGRYGRDEKSFVVVGLDPAQASKIGTDFGQESVLVPEGLLYSDGTVNPSKGVTVHATPPEDFFTKLPDGTTFTVDLDFDNRKKSASFMPAKKEATAELFSAEQVDEQARQSARARAKAKKDQFPEALPVEFVRDERGKIVVDAEGKPRTVRQDYALDQTPLAKEAMKGIRGDEARTEAVAAAYARELVKDYKRVAKNPSIMAGKEWYQIARTKIKALFGDDTPFFAQLLAATSARTDVASNYRYAVEAYQGFKRGDYDSIIKKYNEGLKKLNAGTLLKESGKETEAAALEWWIDKHDLVPKRSNGKQYGQNSGAVMRVLAGVWEDMVQGPKTPNFAGNLAGTTLEATIDVWAARNLRRLGHINSEGTRWRILPESETGVSDPDFYLGQAAFRKAADALGMNPDDLQGLMWFAEKDVWEKNGWTRGAGAEKSDFNYFLDRTSRKGTKITLDESDKAEPDLFSQ